MDKITVIGHKAPDTDTVCSAIGYAWVLNKISKKAEAYITADLNKETKYVLETFNLQVPEIKESFEVGEKVIIVDTNNPEEIIDGIEDAELLEIIDHHKLAGLKTDSPVKVKISTVGCTATLIYRRANYEKVELPADIAGILLAAIISDTLKFTSPTTTEEDQRAAEKLAEISGKDIEEFANAMFAAKSDLSGLSPKEILLSDSKVFDMGDKKVRVSVLETTLPENAKDKKPDLLTAMTEIKNEENLDGMFFFVVNILESNASILTWTEEERDIAKKAFDINYEDFIVLPGVVSRKKQIVPKLEKAYTL